MTSKFNRVSILLTSTAILLGFANFSIAGNYDGTWVLDDTDGKPFEAVLNSDGSASGTHGDAMKYGTWKEENGAAVIHWKTGWTTRISKQGDHYLKTAFKPGLSLSDKPTNTSDAKRK